MQYPLSEYVPKDCVPKHGQIDWHDRDITVMQAFQEETRRLCELVDEMVAKHPEELLSPVLRHLLIDQARKVNRLHGSVGGMLRIDNPGAPINYPQL